MSESVKFQFWISINELKSCERMVMMGELPASQSGPLYRDDFAHLRNVVYRLRQAFAGVPTEPETSQPGVTNPAKPNEQASASEPVYLLCEAVLATREAFSQEEDSPSAWGSLSEAVTLAKEILNRK